MSSRGSGIEESIDGPVDMSIDSFGVRLGAISITGVFLTRKELYKLNGPQ